MIRPLSNDRRERVVAAVREGESCRTVAAWFGVAVSSVVKRSQRYRTTGSVAPGQMGGHRKSVLDPQRAFIIGWIERTPAPDAARVEGRAGQAGRQGLALCGVAVPAPSPSAEGRGIGNCDEREEWLGALLIAAQADREDSDRGFRVQRLASVVSSSAMISGWTMAGSKRSRPVH